MRSDGTLEAEPAGGVPIAKVEMRRWMRRLAASQCLKPKHEVTRLRRILASRGFRFARDDNP